MTSDLVAAGIGYTILDDFHFKNAGLAEEQLHGYYLTEDDGNLLAVFPDSEPLRYLMPFASPQETIDYLGRLAARQPGAIAVFGDDGEKFGAWPGTKKHVYDDGWLSRFFDLLSENRSWIESVTPSEVLDSTPPVDKIYLPEGSYREMTEWVLPAEQLAEYAAVRRELEHDPRWPRIARFVRGGFWRNFRVKYPESNEMYCRMMMVSKRLQSAIEAEVSGELIDEARAALYRGQCNCPLLAWRVWRRVFAPPAQRHLSRADHCRQSAQSSAGKPAHWVELTADDYTFDGRQEVQLASDKLVALIAPGRGGMLYELDVRRIAHNLLATLTRRPEAYHRKVLAGADGRNDVAGVSEQVIFKQEGLDSRLQYDSHPRKSLIDHFYDPHTTLAAVAAGEAIERGDFVARPYEARLRRNPNRMQVQLTSQGAVGESPVKVTKSLTLGSRQLDAGDRLPAGRASARPATVFWRRVQLRRFAVGCRRPLLLRPAARPLWPTRHAARFDGCARAGPRRSVVGHRRQPGVLAADALVDVSDRERQPVGRGLRAGAPIGRRRTALDRYARRRWSLVGGDAPGDRHQYRRKPR